MYHIYVKYIKGVAGLCTGKVSYSLNDSSSSTAVHQRVLQSEYLSTEPTTSMEESGGAGFKKSTKGKKDKKIRRQIVFIFLMGESGRRRLFVKGESGRRRLLCEG